MSSRHFSALLVLAAACGGEAPRPPADGAAPPAATAATPHDACAILPAAEVSAVIGQEVRDSLALSMPATQGSADLSQCNYATGTNPAAVSLMLRREPGSPDPELVSQGPRQALVESGVAVEDVAGIGDKAFWGMNQLHVFTRGGTYLIVTPDPSAGLPQARALAEKALGRL
jgi:hypothetical protein